MSFSSSLEGDLFVTFNTVELMSFLIDCENYLFLVFSALCVFSENLIWSHYFLHIVSTEVSKIRNILENFGVNLRNFSNMNLQMSLRKEAYWTPSLFAVECLHHFNPRRISKHFPLNDVLHI